jgi:two-component system LytT family response regulator
MGSAAPSQLAREPRRGCMRVVVLEPNAEIRDVVQRELDGLHGFALVGESSNWDECLALLKAHLPELFITRTSFASQSSVETACEAAFPVVVGLGRESCVTVDSVFEMVDIPLDPQSIRLAMERARTEIYRRKLDGLSTLLRNYMDYSRGLQRFLTVVQVEDGRTSEIPADDVVFMAADGNYVQLHTGGEVHEVRETMCGMTSKLDPAQFARVHRSFIVNRAHVTGVLRKEGAATSVLLSNGAEVPVGPNYRGELDGIVMPSRLSA